MKDIRALAEGVQRDCQWTLMEVMMLARFALADALDEFHASDEVRALLVADIRAAITRNLEARK